MTGDVDLLFRERIDSGVVYAGGEITRHPQKDL